MLRRNYFWKKQQHFFHMWCWPSLTSGVVRKSNLHIGKTNFAVWAKSHTNGKWSTTQIAIAQHFFGKNELLNTKKWNCLNQLTWLFEQFLFSECRRTTGWITTAQITTAQHVRKTSAAVKTCAVVKPWTCVAVKSCTCAAVKSSPYTAVQVRFYMSQQINDNCSNCVKQLSFLC